MRRERPHPGAQLTLFDTAEGFRHTCFITNTEGTDIAALELRHRGHARVEDRIRNWKDCGLFQPALRLLRPQRSLGGHLTHRRSTAGLEPDGPASTARWPRPSRRPCATGLLHVAALLVHKSRGLILRLDKTWPWVDELANAFVKLRAAIP